MVYLDYAATTPVSKAVLNTISNSGLNYIGNPNANHALGKRANQYINECEKNIKDKLKLDKENIIFTSGSSESNNMAIKGVCEPYNNTSRHIITSPYEHSSVVAPLSYLEKNGFIIDVLELNDDGSINIQHFKELLKNDPLLVTITAVNSELGIISPIEEISNILENYSDIIFHVDMTQVLGKLSIDLNRIDMFSFSAHKIYGLKGIGALVIKPRIKLIPLIHGGKSTTIYRSGTPALELIASLNVAISDAMDNLKNNMNKISKLNNYLITELKTIENIHINSTENSIPNIINFSISGISARELQNKLSEKEIYISTQTACSLNNDYSALVYRLTNDMELAKSSVRVSLSHLTTKQEIDKLIFEIKELIK